MKWLLPCEAGRGTMRSMVEGAGAHHDFDVQVRRMESVLVCIAQAAAPSTAFGGPPPP